MGWVIRGNGSSLSSFSCVPNVFLIPKTEIMFLDLPFAAQQGFDFSSRNWIIGDKRHYLHFVKARAY